jgi:hypothetical protein
MTDICTLDPCLFLSLLLQLNTTTMPRRSKSKCAERKIRTVMREWKSGKLHTRAGNRVRDHTQAIAIALSMARRYCGKKSVPRSPSQKRKRSHPTRSNGRRRSSTRFRRRQRRH